jgi:uridine kinase
MENKNKYKKKYLDLKKSLKQFGGNPNLFVIGIAGASGCGKTFFAQAIKEKLETDGFIGVELISCDNYYKSYIDNLGRNIKAPNDYNWDVPNVLDLDLLAEHIQDLKDRKPVNIPKYNFGTSQREGIEKTIYGNNTKILIVEGLFVLFDENLRNKFDLKIFTLLDSDICLARRLTRDVEERGKSFADTIKQYQLHVKPSYVNYIEPTKRFADLIISTSEFSDTKKSIDIIGTFIQKNQNQIQN